MATDPRVQRLLEDLLDSGGSPEEACRDTPELLPEVRRRWLRVHAVEAQVGELFPEPGRTPPAADTTPSALPPPDLPRILGYEVLTVLGRGGMGVVYEARHRKLNRPVALKMLLSGVYARPDERERFLREAEAVAGLRHPNVVQVHDVGDQDGRPYFTMELVEGGSLAQKLAGTPQPAREAADLVATLADAVQAAHAGGIVHRDLKPANVLLTADGQPKVGDFGLARRLDAGAGLTRSGAAMGTPSYMAPEQARGDTRAVGPATDVYALGAILYEMVTGRPPFRAETVADTVQQVLTREPVPPARLNPKVPRDLEVICLKCLHKEPHLRYGTAAALKADLGRFLGGEAIAARPDHWHERLIRRVRRRPATWAAAAGGTLLTVALLGGGLWLISERATERRRAEAEQAATEGAAGEDLRDMAQWLKQSAWPEARAARERARGRLGDRGSADLRRLLDQCSGELELATRLDAIRLDGYSHAAGALVFTRADEGYEEAFRGAGLGRVADDPEAVATRIRDSNIPTALVAALDHWSTCVPDSPRKDWILAVARAAVPDPTGWRDRARDPLVRKDAAAFADLLATAPVADLSVSLLLALEQQLNPTSPEHETLLKRIYLAHPDDFWINLRLGMVSFYLGKSKEAVGYNRAALALRPKAVIVLNNLGQSLMVSGRRDEGVEHYRQAVLLDPTAAVPRSHFALDLWHLGRHDEAVDQLRVAIRLNPESAILHTALGHSLEVKGKDAEALDEHRQAVALDPKRGDSQAGLRNLLIRQGRVKEARAAWLAAIDANPLDHGAYYGYTEFCLFLGDEKEYHRARQKLLAKFRASTDPYIAERVSRACLLRPATGDERDQVVALAGRAAGVERTKYQAVYPHFLFVGGLADYRQGRFDRAITAMRGDASRVLGPAPRLVLAMALHRSGQEPEARKTLAAAVLAHDWKADRVRDQDGWICHILRREAEDMIQPAAPDGK